MSHHIKLIGRLLAAALSVAAIAQSTPALAAEVWPDKPIRLVVPFAAGGSNDNIARAVAAKLSVQLGQPIVIENKTGGGGTIGTDFVAKSLPDGYNLLLVSTSLTTNAASGKKLPFDPVKDLEPIGLIADSPFAIVVGNDVKATTLQQFLDLARAKPNSINYGSAGVGGMNHLGTEYFAAEAKIKMTHVPYKGISNAFTDLMGGNLQMLLPSLASAASQMQAGRMRGLAMTGAQRSPLAPNLPTAAESGLPGFELEVWFGLMAPARTPPAIVKRLNQELNTALGSADLKAMLAKEGATPRPGPPADLAKLIKTDLARWTRLIKDSNIQVE